MQIQVITDEGLDGATKQLKHLKELQEWIVGANQMVYAEAYSAAGLVEILEVRGANGERASGSEVHKAADRGGIGVAVGHGRRDRTGEPGDPPG